MKKISVIIPCYNTELFIDRCMSSIAAQTIGMNHLEIICINDASTDNTWLLLQKWEQLFPDNVILISLDSNRRMGAARNIGLNYASGDYVSFVDSDDWLETDYFEKLYKPMIQSNCDVAACGFKRDSSDTLTYFDRHTCSEAPNSHLILADKDSTTGQILIQKVLGKAAWAKLIRKDFLLKHGIFFPENLVYEDNLWITLLHIYAKKIYVTDQPLYHWFINSNSITMSKNVDHHADWITIQMMKWHEYEQRGLFQKYREELEYDFLCDAAGFLSVLISRFDEKSEAKRS